MRITKLFVVFLFALFFLASFQNRLISPVAAGQNAPAAPTGVTASDGAYSTKIGLLWDTMRGATVYRIYRSAVNDPNTATEVGATEANYFFDTTAAQGQTFFYWVRAENAVSQSGFSQTDQGTRAFGAPGGGIQPLEPPPVPPGNPVTAAKASLGKALFWDEQLSSTRTVACGTCHKGNAGGIDNRTFLDRARSTNPGPDMIFNTPDDVFGSPGVTANNLDGTFNWSSIYGFKEQVTGRRAMPYTDAAYSISLFWDGRAAPVFRDPLTNQVILPAGAALESQVLSPPVSDSEMAHAGRNWQQVADRIAGVKPLALASNVPQGLQSWVDGRTYTELFEEAFGSPEVTPARIAMAIATHERTLFSDRTPLDQVNQGIGSLTASEQRGFNLFNSGVTNCSACHAGNLLSDDAFHYIGVRPPNDDTGRRQVTNNQGDTGRMRTPNLRNVELRGAYFHNGNFTDLRQVVDFYARGGDFNAPNKDPFIQNLTLSNNQRTDLVAFLSRPLTDVRVRDELPPFDRPTLYTETARVPAVSGIGRAGSGGFVPKVTALEPPLVGNPSFTVAVSDAVGGATAVLVIDNSDPGVGTSIPAAGSFTRQSVSLQGSGGSGAGHGSISLSIPDNPALVGRSFYGRWYVTDASAESGFAVSPLFRFTVFGDGSTVPAGAAHVDFDGDRKTDISIFRPSGGEWWYLKSSTNQATAFQFGAGTDKIVPADYTGDGKTDVAAFRPTTGEWFVLRSEDLTFYAFPFGAPGDIPAPGDFDADGKADPTVFRASNATWYTLTGSQGVLIRQFGAAGDIPQTGDYDADGKADVAVFRPNGASGGGEWWVDRSTGGLMAVQFGSAADKPVAADYTGDGRMDAAVWRPSDGNWYILRSEDLSFYAFPFGAPGDIPAPGDYDGDGRTDAAVFRPSNATWYVVRSTAGLYIAEFGLPGDLPAPAAFVP